MKNEFTVDDYYQSIMAEAIGEAEIEGGSTELKFLEDMVCILSEAGECNDYHIIEDGRDAANRWRLDAYAKDEEAGRLNVFISVFDDAPKPGNLTNTDLEGALKKLQKYINLVLEKDTWESFEPASEIWSAAEDIKVFWVNVRHIHFYVVSNKPASTRIKDTRSDDFRGISTTTHMWDLGRFYNLELSGREREEMIVDLSSGPIPCLVTSESTDEMLSLLAVISGPRLFQLYDEWRGRLLEQNVRTYLSNRGKINKGIRHTIRESPRYFFAYNNGLTTTAEGIKFTDESKSAIKEITNLQIVNGGQTTASIYAAQLNDKVDISKVSVQMKLTVIEPENVERLVPSIARYANCQNKVSDADLFSNHPYHMRIEGFSRRLFMSPKPGSSTQTQWFYERARGQYVDFQAYKKESERKLFQKQNPRDNLLTKTDLAKFENSWVERAPHEVSKGAQANFKKFAHSIDERWQQDDSFFSEFYFNQCIVHALVSRALEKRILKEEWYDGYRAQILSYTIALFSEHLNSNKKCLNYVALYRAQECPEVLLKNLLELAEKVFNRLAATGGNLSTYAKSQAAWEALKTKLLPGCQLPVVLSDCLSNTEDIKQFEHRFKVIQKDSSVIEDEIKVRSLSSDQWIKLAKYLVSMDLATEKKLSIIKTAQDGSNLSEAQIKALVALVKDYERDVESF